MLHACDTYVPVHPDVPSWPQDKLAAMAETVMALVLALKQQTEQKLTDSAQILQSILRAAANDNGEWYIPLRAEEVGSCCSSLSRQTPVVQLLPCDSQLGRCGATCLH